MMAQLDITNGDDVWQDHFIRLTPLLQSALDEGNNTHSLDDIWIGLDKGLYQIWPGEDFVAITEVVQYPQKKVLFFFLMAGKMKHLLDHIQQAEQVAQDLGCSSLMFNGRLGFLRSPLRQAGFNPVWVTMEKEL